MTRDCHAQATSSSLENQVHGATQRPASATVRRHDREEVGNWAAGTSQQPTRTRPASARPVRMRSLYERIGHSVCLGETDAFWRCARVLAAIYCVKVHLHQASALSFTRSSRLDPRPASALGLGIQKSAWTGKSLEDRSPTTAPEIPADAGTTGLDTWHEEKALDIALTLRMLGKHNVGIWQVCVANAFLRLCSLVYRSCLQTACIGP